MSETPAKPDTPAKPPATNWPRLVVIAVVLALVAGGIYAYTIWTSAGPANFPANFRAVVANPDKLDAAFTDADNDLVADAPKEAAKLLDPAEITFGVLEGAGEGGAATWKEFLTHFEKVTGKKAKLAEVPRGGLEAAASLKAGKLHLAALSTGTVPLAVNTGGFVPVCAPANDKGDFSYRMQILVRAGSPIKSLADLRGKDLWLTSMSSQSSFKLPVLTLWQEQKMRLNLDYQGRIANSQGDSIDKVASGEYEVVAVASDYLARRVAQKKHDTSKYRVLHESKDYPAVCIGHTHALKPELAAKVKEAFLTFPWKGTGLEKEFGPAGQSKFAAVDYKKDWAGVREIDKALLTLIDKGT